MTTSTLGRWLRRLIAWPLVLALLIGLYFAIGGLLVHRTDADPGFAADVPVPVGGAATLATLAALMERETDRHGWVANDPFFLPGAILHGMASYQTAIRDEVHRALEDFAGASTGAPPPELETALGAFAAPGDLWTFDLATSWRPQKTSEAYYRDGVAALRELNARLAAGSATVPLAEARDAILARIAASLGTAAQQGLALVEAQGGAWQGQAASDTFLANAGTAYTQLLLLQALGRDLPEVASAPDFAPAEDALAAAAGLRPMVIANGALDGVLRPPHLAVQAALLQRARDAVQALRAGLPPAGA